MKRMKRILAITISLVIVFACMPAVPVFAETYNGTCGKNVTWSLDTDTGVLTISGSGDMSDYCWGPLHGYNNNYTPWYSQKSSIISVNIENSVTRIGDYAFADCSSLTSVTIPDSVTRIGDSAFEGCSSLTSVTIPDGVTSIGSGAFFDCSSLTEILVGNENLKYSAVDGVLFNKDKTELLCCPAGKRDNYVISNSVTRIGNHAFNGCSSLTSVTIPDSVTRIGYGVFHGCSSLTSVMIPDSITSIGMSAFYGCSGLTYVTIPDGVTSIDDFVFAECSSLTSVTIPDSVTSIGSYAFSGCSSLTSVTIPDGVTSIGYYVFRGCSSLTSVTIPDSITRIGDNVFERCSSLTFVTIPDSVISIGSGAFINCSGLTSVTIPDSVTRIGGVAFSRCSSLTSVTIPDSVTSISNGAFDGCSSLTSITIPDSVTRIDDYAFSCCSSLTSITIPDSVTSIGSDAFSGCSGLTSVTIPDSVTSIGNYAFSGCDNIVIYGYSGSAAESYASKNGIKFINFPATTACTTTADSVGRGDTLTVTVSLANCSNLKSMALTPVYDSNVFELVSGEWLLENAILSNFDMERGNAAIAYSAEKNANGDIFKFTLKVKDSAPFGETSLKANPVVKNGSVSIECQAAVKTVTVNCSHSFDSNWSCDANQHWKECLVNGCDEKSEAANHIFDNDCDATCNVCGYIRIIAHRYSEEWSNDDTNHWHECTSCGDKKDMATHNYTEKAEAQYLKSAATCVSKAVYYKSCSVCGAKSTETFEYGEVDPNNHTGGTHITGQKEATCMQKGYTGDTVCNSCNVVITVGSELDYGAHDPSDVWFADDDNHWKECQTVGCGNIIDKASHSGGEATCKDRAVCEICGAAYGDINSDNHKWNKEATVDKEATCTETGVQSIHCGVCDAVKEGTETEIKATGHTFGDWKIIKNATVSEEGMKSRACLKCGFEETQSIPKLLAGQWMKNSKGWWYKRADGSYPHNGWSKIDGKWYYFDVYGYRMTGWKAVGGKWYYMDPSTGIMQTGWIHTGGKNYYYLSPHGDMKTGWQLIDGKWYYLNSSGVRTTGWNWLGGRWYFMDPSTGIMQTGWIHTGGKSYYLSPSGDMKTGWQSINGKWYYLNPSGGARTEGWKMLGKVWYYFEPDTGVMYANQWLNNIYYFRANGAMAVGWTQIDGKWYYFNIYGNKVKNCWIGNYYMKEDGSMAVNEWVDGDRYYVGNNGVWVPNKEKPVSDVVPLS